MMTLLPIVKLVIAVQEANALFPMLMTLSGIVMLVSDRQLLNALVSILVTLSGMVMLVRYWPANASVPMLVTGLPLMLAGMTAAPTESRA